MQLIEWLFQHASNLHTPSEWASLCGIQIIDSDGFDNNSWRSKIGLVEFVRRVGHATIATIRPTQPVVVPREWVKAESDCPPASNDDVQ